MNCRHCGKPASANDRFCSHCGGADPVSGVCPNCSNPVNPGDKFCGGCGAQLTAVQPERQSPSPPPRNHPTTAPDPQMRPSRWWPESAWGNGIYIALIAGMAGFGFAMAQEDPDTANSAWIVAIGLSLSGYVIATIWRNLFINSGALTRPSSQTNAGNAEDGTADSGVNWWAIIGVIVIVAVSRMLIKSLGDNRWVRPSPKIERSQPPVRTRTNSNVRRRYEATEEQRSGQ